MAIIKIKNPAIDLDAAEIPNIDASKITTGSLGADRIPSLAASKIGSGTFADARIAASNVSQHATSFDDNKIVNDISTLAIRQASDANRSAYSTNSQSVDVFQDDTGIDTTTNVFRNSNEYVNSISSAQGNLTNGIAGLSNNGGTLVNTTNYTGYDGVVRSGGQIPLGNSNGYGNYSGFNFNYVFPANSEFELIIFARGQFQGVGFFRGSNLNKSLIGYGGSYWDSTGTMLTYNSTNHPYSGQGVTYAGQYHAPLSGDGSNDYRNLYRFSRNSSNEFKIQYFGRGTGAFNINSTNIANVRNSTNYVQNIGSPFTSSEEFILGFGEATSSDTMFQIEIATGLIETVNATGNFTGTTITAPSSVSSIGAIITYQDNAGTNALNTDIVLQLSADGGSNYSTATLTALPDFATGIKMAKVNDLSVTAGTQLKYKISFANQASGSKEARIRGVSLQY